MELKFPRDTELFVDAETAPAETFLFSPGRGFAKKFHQKNSEYIDQENKSKNKDYAVYETAFEKEMEHEQHNQREVSNWVDHMAQFAAKYAMNKEIGSFPRDTLGTFTSSIKGENEKTVTVHYFNNLSHKGYKSCLALHRTPNMKQIQRPLDTEWKGFALFFLITGAVLLFFCGDVIPLMPDIMPKLMTGRFGIILRIIVALALAIVSIGPCAFQESEYAIAKAVCNGLFCVILWCGVFLADCRLIFSYSSDSSYRLLFLPFALYYLLIAAVLPLDSVLLNRKIEKERKKEIEDYCSMVEKEALPAYRIIRFHTLWWNRLHMYDLAQNPLPSAIKSWQDILDKAVEQYNELSKLRE